MRAAAEEMALLAVETSVDTASEDKAAPQGRSRALKIAGAAGAAALAVAAVVAGRAAPFSSLPQQAGGAVSAALHQGNNYQVGVGCTNWDTSFQEAKLSTADECYELCASTAGCRAMNFQGFANEFCREGGGRDEGACLLYGEDCQVEDNACWYLGVTPGPGDPGGPGGPGTGDKDPTRHRVAILTSGTLQRYMLGQVCTGLVEPLVQQGHTVDYYLALNTASFSSYVAGADTFVPELHGTEPKMQVTIRERINEAGGTLRRLEIFDGVPLSDQDNAFLNRTDMHGAMNLVKKDKKLEELWLGLTQIEREVGQYTIVIIVDDDSIWLKPFDLARLHASSARLHPEGYTLDCSSAFHGVGSYVPKPTTFNDYILILDREVAEPFGKQYSLLVSDSTDSSVYEDELFLGNLVQSHDITLIRRPVGLITMQRGGNQRDEHGNVFLCVHKLCDGEWGSDFPYMRPLGIIPACSSLENVPSSY